MQGTLWVFACISTIRCSALQIDDFISAYSMPLRERRGGKPQKDLLSTHLFWHKRKEREYHWFVPLIWYNPSSSTWEKVYVTDPRPNISYLMEPRKHKRQLRPHQHSGIHLAIRFLKDSKPVYPTNTNLQIHYKLWERTISTVSSFPFLS